MNTARKRWQSLKCIGDSRNVLQGIGKKWGHAKSIRMYQNGLEGIGKKLGHAKSITMKLKGIELSHEIKYYLMEWNTMSWRTMGVMPKALQ